MGVSSGEDKGASRVFGTPVDSEHKCTTLEIWKLRNCPQNVAFHLAWTSYFCAFFSTFAAAALLPVIREDLNLSKSDIGNAGIAAVCGAIGSRVVLGSCLDSYGARWCMATLTLLTCAPVFCMALVTTPAAFVVVRMFVGLGLASFVGNQFWVSNMFTPRIVGLANAMAGGWGNLGGGVVQLVMPVLAQAIAQYVPEFQAWRWAFFLPGCMQLVAGTTLMLLGQDLPDGQLSELRAAGLRAKAGGGWGNWKAALSNYRSWLFTLTYGYCLGIELTVENIVTQYLFDQFSLELKTAGYLGGIFGLMNLFSRPLGGAMSDASAKRHGIRGRLWSLWSVQMVCGTLCLLMGTEGVSSSLQATVCVLIVFSIVCQMASGSTFGIVPFVSKRSTGLVSGMVGSGGNVGSAVTQAVFFTFTSLSVSQGFFWMGVLTLAVSCSLFLVYFPMWGGMLVPAKESVTEEDYYCLEYSLDERASGLHVPSLKFAFETRSQRGSLWNSMRGTPKHAPNVPRVPASYI